MNTFSRYLSIALTMVAVLLPHCSSTAIACTTAVISGRFTRSGRPMIWKVRDTEELANYMRHYEGAHGSYVGLVNASDPTGQQIWGGWNASGFAIMNSASFNVNEGYTGTYIDREGYLMHEALRRCTTLAAFEALLTERTRPMGVAAHFGVIDAEGGAAFYEVNNETWTKYDANDPNVAPRGYVLRTNYSYTGTPHQGLGYVRYATAEALFGEVEVGQADVALIMQSFGRSTRNAVLGTDHEATYTPRPYGHGTMVSAVDLICRHETSSALLVEGINRGAGETPDQTTGWVQIALPFESVTLPMWCSVPLHHMLTPSTAGEGARLAMNLLEAKRELFPLTHMSDAAERYIDIQVLYNATDGGIIGRIRALETDIFAAVEALRLAWRHPSTEAERTDGATALSTLLYDRAQQFYTTDPFFGKYMTQKSNKPL